MWRRRSGRDEQRDNACDREWRNRRERLSRGDLHARRRRNFAHIVNDRRGWIVKYLRLLFAILWIAALDSVPAPAAFFQGQVNGAVVLTCPDNDGSSTAPSGSPPYPNMLTGDFAITYVHTPIIDFGCQVAGVTYNVGYSSGTTLLDPATNVPSGCSYSGATFVLTCASAATVTGLDFSLHNGVELNVTGAHTYVVHDNNFVMGSNCKVPFLVNGTAATSITFYNNVVDGGGATCNTGYASSLGGSIFEIAPASGAVRSYHHNWFRNTVEDTFDLTGATSGTFAPNISFNLFDLQGWNGHPDGVQEVGGFFTGIVIAHNTFRNYPFSGIVQGIQPFHTEAQGTSTITNSTVEFNTVITVQSSNGTGSVCSFPTNCSANEDIACKSDGGGNSNNGFVAYANYIDWRGATSALLSAGGGCTSPVWGTPYSNWDMWHNVALSTSP